MPSLKPFTAPPRSWPMLRSFFVPKMSTTTSSTISQCQMLNPPMMTPLRIWLARDHRSQRLCAAEHMNMHVHHFLPSHTPGIDDGAKTVAGALLARQPAGERQELAEHRRIVRRRVVQARHMLLRHEHEVHGR